MVVCVVIRSIWQFAFSASIHLFVPWQALSTIWQQVLLDLSLASNRFGACSCSLCRVPAGATGGLVCAVRINPGRQAAACRCWSYCRRRQRCASFVSFCKALGWPYQDTASFCLQAPGLNLTYQEAAPERGPLEPAAWQGSVVWQCKQLSGEWCVVHSS